MTTATTTASTRVLLRRAVPRPYETATEMSRAAGSDSHQRQVVDHAAKGIATTKLLLKCCVPTCVWGDLGRPYTG